MHQNLMDKSNHHQSIIAKYEENMAHVQGELTQTKAKLVELQKEKENQDKALPNFSKSLSSGSGEEKWVCEFVYKNTKLKQF